MEIGELKPGMWFDYNDGKALILSFLSTRVELAIFHPNGRFKGTASDFKLAEVVGRTYESLTAVPWDI